MNGVWWEYVLILSGTTAVCVGLTPFLIAYATRANLLDLPGGHKSHERAIPYLGGVAIVVAFVAATVAMSIIQPPHSGRTELLVILGIALALSAMGLIDDLKELSPTWRIVVEIAAAVAVWAFGNGTNVTDIQALDLGLTVLWFVGITNAFNLLDNMDGLAAGLAAIVSLTIFAIAANNGQFLVAALSIGLAGCAVGFLRHNFHPARIYMGDGGALFLGFVIAYLGIKLRFESGRKLSALIPVLVCSIAVLDTTLVTASRLIAKRNPFQGGRDHISHRLVKLGLSIPIAVATIYLGAASMGVLTFVISSTDPGSAWVLIGLAGIILILVGGFLLTVSVYPHGLEHDSPISDYSEDS